MHERVRAASDMNGWLAVQLLREVDAPWRGAIIGTWQSREHWGPLARRRDIQGNPRGAGRARIPTVQHRLVRRGGGTGLRT